MKFSLSKIAMTKPERFNSSTLKQQLSSHSPSIDPWFTGILACFVGLAWASWGKVGDPITDFGREVEIPARLADGQVLYRDVNTYYGPLSYYANALWLLLFGHHLEVFYVVNLILALTATLLIYQLAKQLTDSAWSSLCTLCVLIYCIFNPGLFNFISPYSYGAAYGLVFCLLAFTTLERYKRTGKMGWLIGAAIAGGFAALAKQEYGIAAIGSILVGFNLCAPHNLRTRVTGNALILSLAIICIGIPLALLVQHVSWQEVQQSLLPTSKLAALSQSSLFQVSPIKTLKIWTKTFAASAASFLFTGASMQIAYQVSTLKELSKLRQFRSLVEVLLSVILAWFSLTLLQSLLYLPSLALLRKLIFPEAIFHPLGNLSWSLPLIVGWFVLNRWKQTQHKHAALLWTLLSFALLLNTRWLFVIDFYGLYAMPVIVLFFAIFYVLTKQDKRTIWRYVLVCLLIGGASNLAYFQQYNYAIQSSYGTLYDEDANIALAFNQTIQMVETARAKSILVLPEGSLLNFLTATHSPSQETTFLPSIFPTAKDENEFVNQMQANPPELIIYVKRSFPEWNYQTYADFNPIVDRWITDQYKLTDVFPKPENAIVRIYRK